MPLKHKLLKKMNLRTYCGPLGSTSLKLPVELGKYSPFVGRKRIPCGCTKSHPLFSLSIALPDGRGLTRAPDSHRGGGDCPAVKTKNSRKEWGWVFSKKMFFTLLGNPLMAQNVAAAKTDLSIGFIEIRFPYAG